MDTIIDYLSRGTEKYTTKYWVEKDKSAEFPSEFLASISELGLTSVLLPEEFGGPGMSISDYVKLVRQVSGLHGVAGGDLLMAHNTFGIFPLVSMGSKEQKEEYLPKLGSNKIIPSIAITEPNAGSDTLNISTRAVKSNGEYILSGRKIWITMAHLSNLMLVLARTSNEHTRTTKGLSLFLVDPKEHKNIRISRIDDIALRCLGSCEVFFDDVDLPESSLLGNEGEGWKALTPVLNLERLSTASMAVGASDLIMRETIDYAVKRKLFGKSLGSNQAVQFPLAQGKIASEASWRLIRDGAAKHDRGEDYFLEANAGAYLAANSAFQIADHAMQVFGGMAFAVDMGIEMHWRNLRLFRVGPVSEQMALSLISRHILGMPPSF